MPWYRVIGVDSLVDVPVWNCRCAAISHTVSINSVSGRKCTMISLVHTNIAYSDFYVVLYSGCSLIATCILRLSHCSVCFMRYPIDVPLSIHMYALLWFYFKCSCQWKYVRIVIKYILSCVPNVSPYTFCVPAQPVYLCGVLVYNECLEIERFVMKNTTNHWDEVKGCDLERKPEQLIINVSEKPIAMSSKQMDWPCWFGFLCAKTYFVLVHLVSSGSSTLSSSTAALR